MKNTYPHLPPGPQGQGNTNYVGIPLVKDGNDAIFFIPSHWNGVVRQYGLIIKQVLDNRINPCL